MIKNDGMFCLQTNEQHAVVTVGIDGEKNANLELMGTLNTGSKSGSGQQPAVMALNTSNGVPSLDSEMGTLDRRAGASAVGAQTRGVVLAFNWQNGGGYGEANIGLGITEEGTDPLSKSQIMAVTQPTVVCTTGEVTHALTHEGADASEDGTGRGTPIVLASGQANAEVGHGVSPTLTLLHEAPIAVVGTLDVHDSTKWGSHQWVAQDKAMVSAGRPRRLTPLECERLMSWPDQWTATGRKEDGTEYALSDTARYRLCGNGVGSVCVAWFAQRLAAML